MHTKKYCKEVTICNEWYTQVSPTQQNISQGLRKLELPKIGHTKYFDFEVGMSLD